MEKFREKIQRARNTRMNQVQEADSHPMYKNTEGLVGNGE